MRELIAYFRSKVALQAELLESNKHRLALKFRIKDRNEEIDRLVRELSDTRNDLVHERRLSGRQAREIECLRQRAEAQDKTLAPFLRSPWGRVILDLPWHEHAEFLEAFFGKPKEEAYAEWKRDTQIRAEASNTGAGQPTGEGK